MSIEEGITMFNALEPWHLLIIVGVLVVLFGAKRLPGSARSLGRSMRIFRTEIANGRGEHDEEATEASTTIPPAATPSVASASQPASLANSSDSSLVKTGAPTSERS